MRVTQVLCKYVPEWYHIRKSNSSYFKKQSYFHMTRFYKNLGWSKWKGATNRYQYYLDGEMYYGRQISHFKMDMNSSRIAAACEEHDYNYSHFLNTLPKIDIYLSLSSLARLAIYEPKTFKSLINICREMTNEPLEPANFNVNRI